MLLGIESLVAINFNKLILVLSSRALSYTLDIYT